MPSPIPAFTPTFTPHTRLNVNLIPLAAKALEELQERTGYKKVDIVNKALQLYALMDQHQRQGDVITLETTEGHVREFIIL